MKSSLLYLTLGGLLAAAVAVAIYTWDQMAGVSLSTHGVIALVLGVVVSLALGVGLMALVFFSHRKGYDRLPGTDSSHSNHPDDPDDPDEPDHPDDMADKGDAASKRQDGHGR